MSSLIRLSVYSLVFLLTACGGGSSSGGGSTDGGGTPTPSDQTGYFVDGPVRGLDYTRSGRAGSAKTGANGDFLYVGGETLTFALGKITLGNYLTTPKTAFITPFSLAPANRTVAINIARFLLTLDSDGNPDNGIQLSAKVQDSAIGYAGDLDFENLDSSELAQFAQQANGGAERELVSPEAAERHLEESEKDISDGQYDFDKGIDSDGDTISDTNDRCPNSTPPVADDGCANDEERQADSDGDGIVNAADNCPAAPNEDQADFDNDQRGDVCDRDDDNDGVLDEREESQGSNPRNPDTDGDAITDGDDNCPAVANPDQADNDRDDLGDACDGDDDNDGTPDTEDDLPFDPTETTDTDGDGIGNNKDEDDDNDGVVDSDDAFPLNPGEDTDTDGDGIGNNADTDDDNDGVPDNEDAFPLDDSESVDTDGDGVGNNADDDDDNDNTPDDRDAFPQDPSEDTDTDGDGIGNNADEDDDNDGFSDDEDAFPLDPEENKDSDGDGIGDNGDQCSDTPQDEPSNDLGCSVSQIEHSSCVGGFHLEDNRPSYQVVLTTHDNKNLSFQVLPPKQFDCANRDNGAHPLMMHGPGYSLPRETDGFDDYRAAGYTVISWDPRGFGGTGGTVRAMDPDFEGRYLNQILDWAEQNLDYLAWRDESTGTFAARPDDARSIAGGVNLLVGAQGSSYGGGFQLALLATDDKKRLDAIAPNITWHDLRYSLNPGDVVKSAWGLVLTGAGESQGNASGGGPIDDGQDPFIKETLARALATNEWPRRSLDWFHYRGLGYWCAANGLPAMPYPTYSQDDDRVPMIDAANSYNVPARKDGKPGLGNFLTSASPEPARYFEGLDVLLTHGMIDTLFNFNEAWWNARCLSAAGANVTLQTHYGQLTNEPSGHVLPVVQSPDKASSGTGVCASTSLAWFEEKLRNGNATNIEDVCFALGTDGDTVSLAAPEVLAPQAQDNRAAFTKRNVLPLAPVPNGATGALHGSGNAAIPAPLGIATSELILAGIPRLEVTVSSLTGLNEMACENGRNSSGTRDGCDSITFVGLGRKTGFAPNFGLIDDQLTPLRGLGTHSVDLVGLAERLQPGDELAVLFFAQHPQFATAASRDLSLPALTISGTIDLPLYTTDADGNPQPGANPGDQLVASGSQGLPLQSPIAGCYADARAENCALSPLANLLSEPKKQVCLNGGLTSAECPLSQIVNPLAENDPSGTIAALSGIVANVSACLVNADLPLCQFSASECERDPSGTACSAVAVLDVVHDLSDTLGLPLSGRYPGKTYCDLPAGDPDPATDAQAWQQRDFMNVLCSLQRLTDMYLHPAFAVALAEGTARTFSFSLIEQLADPTRPRGTLGQWVPGGRTTDPYRIEQDWEDAGRGRVDYISFVAEDGARLVGRVFRPPASVPGPYPAVVITTGSIQGYQEMYNWAAQGLAEAGYLVLSYDVQGQGRSESLPHQPDGNYACDSNGCEGVPFQQSYNFLQGARDAHRWLLSSESEPYIAETANSSGSNLFNPFSADVDRSRIGHAGHSLGASAISVVGQELACEPETPRDQRDGCVSAIVGWDSLSAVSDTQALPIKAPGLSLTAEYFFNPTPANPGNPPDPDSKLGAYKQMVAAEVDSMRVGLRSSTHLEWTYVPLILPASRYGERVSMHYTEAWFDRYLRDDATAVDRLTAYVLDDTADLSSIGAGTFDPFTGANVPYKIAGDCVADRLSFYQRSAYRLSDPRDNSVRVSENMRARGCLPDSDGDGVPDSEDAFPNDPNESKDSDDDGIGDNSDPDDDNDGVEDSADLCSNTAPGSDPDANGCATEQLDTDNDGVNDQIDQCPNTSSTEAANEEGCGDNQISNASCAHNRNLDGSSSYQVTLDSDSGNKISFQVLEPKLFDCDTLGAHPLVLHGHGFGGSRSTSGFEDLRENGYTVISIDQRGFGDSGGTVRVMDPDFEGKDLIKILDWAEQNLDYLAWRNEASGAFVARPKNATSESGGINLVVGATGSSYGGGYQLLLHAVDEKDRLDAMVPDITWHDLRYSLNPGDTLKTAWDLLLVAGGEAGSYGPGFMNRESPMARGLDPYIKETLLRGASTNEFPRDALEWFRYHSPTYWCALNGEATRPYAPNDSPLNNNLSSNLPGNSPGANQRDHQPAVDVLLTQGMRDTLFNFNDAWWNYQCLSDRAADQGGDVRLLTHQSGHILQGFVDAPGPLKFQEKGGNGNCGSIDRNAATLAWFNEKLKGETPDSLITGTKGNLCISLADNDAVLIPDEALLATRPHTDTIGANSYPIDNLAISGVPNGVLAQQLYMAGMPHTVLPLVTVDDANGAIVAGIPLANLTVTSPQMINDIGCGVGTLPTLRTGCDSITYIGLGVKRAGSDEWQLIDDQIMPVRGLGEHPNVEMVGVAERLHQGDELALLVYGYHPQYLASFSRDPSIQSVNLNGSIELPLYAVGSDGGVDLERSSQEAVRPLTTGVTPCSNLSTGLDSACAAQGTAAHVVRTFCHYHWQNEFCNAFAFDPPGYDGCENDCPLSLKVGAVHEHSGYSDGDPEMIPADYFKAGRVGHNTTDEGNGDSGVILDFMWSSEHSDNEKLPVTTAAVCASPSENFLFDFLSCSNVELNDHYFKWQATLEQAIAATERDGDDYVGFTALRGFEWTNDFYNHLNVYGSTNIINAKNDGSYASMDFMWNWLRTPVSEGGGADGLVSFNHPGGDPALTPFDGSQPHNELLAAGGGANWNDLAYVPDVDENVVAMEVRGGDDIEFYVKALSKGWHIGPVDAEDEHQREWANTSDGKTLILTRGRKPQDYYHALKNRRTIAVHGSVVSGQPGMPVQTPKLLYWANGSSVDDGAPLGSIIKALPASQTQHALHILARDLPPGARLALVSNTGGGQANPIPLPGSADSMGEYYTPFEVNHPTSGQDWYFVVACPATETNCGGNRNHILVSAPIWFGESDKSGGTGLVGVP